MALAACVAFALAIVTDDRVRPVAVISAKEAQMISPQITERPRSRCRKPRHLLPLSMLVGLLACNGPNETFPNITFPPSLKGLVKDAVTGAAIVGATVTTGGITTTTTTGGAYVFAEALTAGVASVKVTHPAYVDSERQVAIQAFTQADFELQPK